MKAAVFSDTHSNTALMKEAVRRLRPDLLIHLGDYDRDADCLRAEFPEIPLFSVCGNCDVVPTAPEKDVVPIGSVKAFLCHGHQYNVRWGGVDSLVYAAMEAGCQIALFGHTHEAYNGEIAGVKVINPGSAGKGRTPTFALIEVFDNGGIACEIREL